MMEQTMFFAQPKKPPAPMRAHDYLFDSSYIVSGAKDYARMAFTAAMQSSQVGIQPIFQTMFSEIKSKPRCNLLYYPNCRLPDHMVCTYDDYQESRARQCGLPSPELGGKDRFRFSAMPREILSLNMTEPDFLPLNTHQPKYMSRPQHRKIQTVYRESSAQTIPWQPGAFVSKACVEKPEVLYLDKLEWGPGEPYRKGDLPADFHSTEIINKMRHARRWMDIVELGKFPRWMKRRADIVKDVESKDWIFREAEIDELQEIRLYLLHKLQNAERKKIINKQTKKLAKIWTEKKKSMEDKIGEIHRIRDRELRKLHARHISGGSSGLAARKRAARGMQLASRAACDPTSDTRAPLARHGYQARRKHVDITYDPQLLVYEDHRLVDNPPSWLEQCPQKLKQTCSGHYLRPDPNTLCERETKWSEKFLKNLHDELIKARLGAASTSAGPLRVLKPRRLVLTPRPRTPEVEAVQDADEANHQAALTLQRLVRGRAVQMLMYEGRTRAAELTEELKTTHGLQKEDRIRIAREEARSRDYDVMRNTLDQKEEAISALVDELCGGAVSAALDFLEKELRRLREERRQHAFILIALREKSLRESAEAGRRQKEVQRLREHDEMFKRVLGVTQDTVDAYLKDIAAEGVELYADAEAQSRAATSADRVEACLREHGSMSTAEQNELVAELVQQFLLPEAHKAAARQRISATQRLNADVARRAIFDYFDEAEIKKEYCARCGEILDEQCRCRRCGGDIEPTETPYRKDPRWKYTTRRDPIVEKDPGERIPPHLEFRCLLDTLLDEAVSHSRSRAYETDNLVSALKEDIETRYTIAIDAAQIMEAVVKDAVGETSPPVAPGPKDYRHTMLRVVPDALERSEPYQDPEKIPVPRELPSQVRARARAAEDAAMPWCRCESPSKHKRKVVRMYGLELLTDTEKKKLLPSELRVLEDMRRCKCDDVAAPTPTEQVVELDASSSAAGGVTSTGVPELTLTSELTDAADLEAETRADDEDYA